MKLRLLFSRAALFVGCSTTMVALLAGCEDPALDRGRAPPIVVTQTSLSVPLHGYAPARGLRRALGTLSPDGESHAVDAVVETVSQSQAASARALLVELGLQPDRVIWRNNAREDIVLIKAAAHTTPCSSAIGPAWLGDAQQSVGPLGSCIQANALAQMVSDPRDLLHPVALGPTNGAVAARAVGQWEAGTVAKARDSRQSGPNAGEDGSGGDDGGSTAPSQSAQGASSSGSQPAHSSGAADNPLLSTAPLPGASAE